MRVRLRFGRASALLAASALAGSFLAASVASAPPGFADVTQNNGCLGVTGTFSQFAVPITGTATPNPATVPNAITLNNTSVAISVDATLIGTGVTTGLVSAAPTLDAITTTSGTDAVNAPVGAVTLKVTGTNTSQGTQTASNAAAATTTFYVTRDATTHVVTVYTAINPPAGATPVVGRTGTVLVGNLTVPIPLSSTTWTPTGGNVLLSEANVVPGNLTSPSVPDQALAPLIINAVINGTIMVPFNCWTGTVTGTTTTSLVPAAPSAIDTVTVNSPPSAPTCATPQATSVGGGQSVTVTPNCTNNNPPFNLATSTVAIVTPPTNGMAAVQPGNTISYSNTATSTATTDTFTYTVANTVGTSNLVTVNISVLTGSCTVTGTPATCSLKQVLIVPVAPSTMSMSQAGNQDVLGCGFHSLPTSPTQPCDSTPLTLNGQPQYAAGALSEVTVINARGTDAGWSLTGQVTDFIDGTRGPTDTCSPPAANNIAQTPPNNHCIPGGNLGWFPAASIVDLAVPGDTAAVAAGNAILPPSPAPRPGGLTPVPGLHNTAQMLCTSPANQSGGTFHCDAGLIVAVPASAAAALTPGYTATLTLTLA